MVALGLLFFQSILQSLFPLILGKTVDAVAAKSMNGLLLGITAYGMLALLRTLSVYTREKFELCNIDYLISEFLAQISMKKFFSISMGQHSVGHSLIKRSVIAKGEASVNGLIHLAVYELVPILFSIAIPMGFLMWKVPSIGSAVLASVLMYALYTIKYNNRFVSRLKKLDTMSNKIGKKYGEVTGNADVVFVNAQEERIQVECSTAKQGEGNFARPMWISYIAWYHSGQGSISVVQTSCIGILGYLAIIGAISAGDLVTGIMWLSSVYGTLWSISSTQRHFTKMVVPIEKYFRFLDYKPDILVPENPVPMGTVRGEIEFRNVRFTYGARTDADEFNDDSAHKEEEEETAKDLDEEELIPAIKGVSFKLEPGKRYAFVGGSGAGKSTIVGLILRAYDPNEGEILIDGHDLRTLDYREVRRNIGLVPQEVSLFDGTLKYNVLFGLNGEADKVTPEELEKIAHLSRISEFFHKLEKGWETFIGERGIKLSGGQKQRVGIARALVKNPHVLILDEATSNLDTENEEAIRKSIVEASEGKTTIIIAHRLATVKDADQILVFNEGNLVGQGTHYDLLSTNCYYQRLVNSQVIKN